MNKQIRELLAKKQAALQAARAISDKAASENRAVLSDDEQKAYDAHMASVTQLDAAIARETALAAAEAQVTAAAVPGATIIATSDNRAEDPKRGFATFGQYAQAVRAAAMQGARPDERLLIGAAAPTTFGSEGVGQDGGFAVPPEYSKQIWTMSLGEDSLLPMCDTTELGDTNSMVFPKDETTPWGTDGIRAYWQAEATAANQTKPKIGLRTLRLHKLMALVPLTDELVADQNALGSYLPSKVADSIRWKTNEGILLGTGAGQPQGVLSAAALVVVAKESGQATLTLDPKNLAKMIARLPAGSYPRSVWLINNDVLPALFTLTLGNYPIYLPPTTGVQGNPYGSLLGRPIMVSQHCASFTNQGDVQLHDFSYVQAITKAGGIQSATSIHLYFDADATAFRSTFRVDAQPKIAASITPAKGSNNLSPFVTLQAR